MTTATPVITGAGVSPVRPAEGFIHNVWIGKKREGLFPALVAPRGVLRSSTFVDGSDLLAEGLMYASFLPKGVEAQKAYFTGMEASVLELYDGIRLQPTELKEFQRGISEVQVGVFRVTSGTASVGLHGLPFQWARMADEVQVAFNESPVASGDFETIPIGLGFRQANGKMHGPKSIISYGDGFRASLWRVQTPKHAQRRQRCRAQWMLAAALKLMMQKARPVFGSKHPIPADLDLVAAAGVALGSVRGKLGLNFSGIENDPDTASDLNGAMEALRGMPYSRGYLDSLMETHDYATNQPACLDLLKATLLFNTILALTSERVGGWKMPVRIKYEKGNYKMAHQRLRDVLEMGKKWGGSDDVWWHLPSLDGMSEALPWPTHVTHGTMRWDLDLEPDEYSPSSVPVKKGEADLLSDADPTLQEFWLDVERDARLMSFKWSNIKYQGLQVPLGTSEYVADATGALRQRRERLAYGSLLYALQYFSDPVKRPAYGVHVDMRGAARLDLTLRGGEKGMDSTDRAPPRPPLQAQNVDARVAVLEKALPNEPPAVLDTPRDTHGITKVDEPGDMSPAAL